jgi:UDP-N-acetylmuramate dehydrogenase
MIPLSPARSPPLNPVPKQPSSMPSGPHHDLPATIAALIENGGLDCRRDEPLSSHVSMGVGGPARWLITVERHEALEPLLAALRPSKIPWMILGGGSNTFFADEGYAGMIVKLGRAFRAVEPGPGPHQLTAGAGAMLSALMNASKRAGLAGLEWAAGVPGTLGGALAGNSGTAFGDACTGLDRVEVLDAKGTVPTLAPGEFICGYRHSSLAQYIILRATYALHPDDPEAIQKRIDEGLAKRRAQPLGRRCAGCMFKNPPGDAAGRLIDAAGLKGLAVGHARVADEHANFIVNEGGATAAEIEELVDRVRRGVEEKWGIRLELEIHLVRLDSSSGIV